MDNNKELAIPSVGEIRGGVTEPREIALLVFGFYGTVSISTFCRVRNTLRRREGGREERRE